MQQSSTPIWWCIMRQEPINYNISCVRILVAEKATLEKSDELYSKHQDVFREVNVSGHYPYVQLFHREPEETPIMDRFERDSQVL